jgi:hypothetical protein
MRILSLCILLAGCNGPAPGLFEPDATRGYQACATDENWRTFNDQELAHLVKTDDTQATAFQPPLVDGASFPASPAPTFTWQVTATIPGMMNGDASCPTVCRLCTGSIPTAGTMCNLCGAHLPAVSGDSYDLQFSVGGSVVWRIITTAQFYQPPDDIWASWRGKTVSLATVRAFLKLNDVQEIYQASKPLTFSVGM